MKLQDIFYSLNTNVFYPHFLLICEFCQLWSWEVGIRNRSCDQITKQAEIFPSATWAVQNCRKISSSNHVVTYVTFIQNIIVNLILLNNIGVQWSCAFVLQAVRKLWGRWSDSSRSALMVSLFLKSNSESLGESSYIFYLITLTHHPWCPLRFANRLVQFVSTYAEGLTGVQAVWANKKYHGRRTLPPEMIAEVKRTVYEHFT